MRVSDYRTLIEDLELKKAELTQVHDQYAFGYAKIVLAEARAKIQGELDMLLNMELKPVAEVISLTANSDMTIQIGESEQLQITARLSDGTSKTVTAEKYAFAFFRDPDIIYNNAGVFTGVDVSNYAGDVNNSYKIVKTAVGWNVYDLSGEYGLEVVQVADENGDPVANTFSVINVDGEEIGLTFTTDGNEQAGDNWKVDVSVELTGTTYSSENHAVATVDSNGLVKAVNVGSTNIIVRNNNAFVSIPVTVI